MTPSVGYTEMKDSGVHWIGQIPKEWKVQKLFRCFGLIGSGTTPKSQVEDYYNGNIPWLQSGDINGGIVKSTAKSIKEIALTECSALRMYNAPFIAVAMYGASIANTSIVAIDACTNQACCVLSSPQNGIDYQFVFYAILSAKEELLLCARGGTQPNISQEILKQFRLPLPSLQEQTAIATYLDTQCAKIDEIIAEAKASIEDYKQWKASIIYEAVTKGLDPKAEMKDSGIEWVGEIPEGWNINVLFQLISQVKNKNKDLVETNLLSLSYGKIKRKNIDHTDGLIPASFDSYNIIEDGDIVLRLTDLQNDQTSLRVGHATERGIITSAYTTLRPVNYKTSKFIYYLLHAFDIRKGFYGMGAGVRQGLNYDEVKVLKLPLPPIDEQSTITTYLDAQCAKIDELSTEKQSLITDLEAYKKSLIYEVVTGKRRVI